MCLAFSIALCLLDLRGLLLVLAFALLWWRLLSLRVIFTSTEMISVGLFLRKRVKKEDAVRLEDGSQLVYRHAGLERRTTITLALGYSAIDDNTPDARIKQRISLAFTSWQRGDLGNNP